MFQREKIYIEYRVPDCGSLSLCDDGNTGLDSESTEEMRERVRYARDAYVTESDDRVVTTVVCLTRREETCSRVRMRHVVVAQIAGHLAVCTAR